MPSTSGCSPSRSQLEHEIVTLRASVHGRGIKLKRAAIRSGGAGASAAVVGQAVVLHGRQDAVAPVYDRTLLKAGNRIKGPAIIVEMDSTTRHPAETSRQGR